ncbi:MAG: acetylxylan esterase [Phycisphaeraceae bacterium]|nr:acetylxylan esterase [Phycisphaeraceae bacterium]
MKFPQKPLSPSLGIRSGFQAWIKQPPRCAFAAKSPTEAEKWRKNARKTFWACLGNAPAPTPLKVKVLEKARLDGYSRTTLTLDTAQGITAMAWYCVPDSRKGQPKGPAMIATPGHGVGALDLLAMTADGSPRPEGEGYQKDYALQAVRLGYPTLVVEPLGFGLRRDAAMMAEKSQESGCHAASTIATMLGTTLMRIRINDIQRGLDWLIQQPEVDAKRVGMMGISGGGQLTLWTAALEPRIAAVICSGYFNRFRTSVMSIHHCICNFAPGVAKAFEMGELGAMVAPRPMLIQSGTKDCIFPIAASRSETRRLRGIYKVWDADDRVEHDVFVGEHQWSPRRVETFLARWL